MSSLDHPLGSCRSDMDLIVARICSRRRTVRGHKKSPSRSLEGPIIGGFSLVVPTGLFPVKTGIYMPNNFKGLDRRPLGELT
jgi:hypothetical protein